MLKALVAVPGEQVHIREIPEGMKPIHEIVGGSLECIFLGNGWMMYCNQDGNELDLPVNPHFSQGIVKGPFVIVKTGPDGGVAGLEAKDFELAVKKFIRNQPELMLK